MSVQYIGNSKAAAHVAVDLQCWFTVKHVKKEKKKNYPMHSISKELPQTITVKHGQLQQYLHGFMEQLLCQKLARPNIQSEYCWSSHARLY